MSGDLDPHNVIVQIHHATKPIVVGTGFVIGQDLIVTCAHVIESGGYTPSDKVKVVLHETGQDRTAYVLPDAYQPANGDDVAFLHLEAALPKAVKPLPLGESEGCNGHRFQAFGYARVGTIEGVFASGEIKGLVKQSDGRPLLQLASPELDRGISGSPVFDTDRQHVVGMVTAVYYPDSTTKHRDTALATPAEVLHRICPQVPLLSPPWGELFFKNGRLRSEQFLRRSVWSQIWRRLRTWARVRPVQMVAGAMTTVLLIVLAIMAGQSYLNRGWRTIPGGTAMLGASDDFCAESVPPFEIQVTEVTNQDYLPCVRKGNCSAPPIWSVSPQGWLYPSGEGQHPVFGLTWQDADAYCRSVGARLPTEAEWVLAARGSTTRNYPWGDVFDASRANLYESTPRDTWAVMPGNGARCNDQQVCDMIGNVREWVSDTVKDPCVSSKGAGAHVAKGGAFSDSASYVTIWLRMQSDEAPYVGVRCVRSH